MFNNSKKIILINLLVVVLFLILPYYIFEGKLFIGGDDTRLFYVYPLDWIKNISFFSWFNFSSLGSNNPNQFTIPTLIPFALLDILFSNDMFLNYLVFSLVFIAGFLSFQLLISGIIKLENSRMRLAALLGGLFYVCSPIIIASQISSFLYSVWLISLLPVLTYLFIRYLNSNNFKYVFFAVIFCLLFSISMFSVPWILGYVLSVIPGLFIALFLYSRKQVGLFIKKMFTFFGIIALSQSFWLLPTIMSVLSFDKTSFGSQSISVELGDDFANTVSASATGNVVLPLLNLFHRQIAFDFNWSLKEIFIYFYDKTFLLNIFFVGIFFYLLLNYRKVFNKSENKVFLIILISFITSLFLFTVNVGFLNDLFNLLRYIPGFLMFRNFYDKFNLAYILLYSIVITISLVILNRQIKNKIILVLINAIFLILIVVNFLPTKQLLNSPIWTTKNIYSNAVISDEYLGFMKDVGNEVRLSGNILSIPLNIAGYTLIKGSSENDIFIGRSPIQLFTRVNDFSGDLSFSPQETSDLNKSIKNRDYEEINNFLNTHNINYIFLTKNIPKEIMSSYLFDPLLPSFQDKEFLNALTDKMVVKSYNDNYELYSVKDKSSVLQSKNIYFQKINPVKYHLYIQNIKNSQDLLFLDSFSDGWKLFLQKNPSNLNCNNSSISVEGIVECGGIREYFSINDLKYSLTRNIFNNSHDIVYDYANYWKLNTEEVISNYPKDYYVQNSDGSLNIELVLYFVPQNYFYYGTAITIIVFLFFPIYFLIKKK